MLDLIIRTQGEHPEIRLKRLKIFDFYNYNNFPKRFIGPENIIN